MDISVLSSLLDAVKLITWQQLVMLVIGGGLVYLAIAHDIEPMLLLPIGFGAIITNLPLNVIFQEHGLLRILYDVGIETEIFPLLLFIGLGAMTDFGPLLENPKMSFLGAAGHLGVFATLLLAIGLGFPLNSAATIAIIGTMDGPTSIYVAQQLDKALVPAIAVAAYSYMSLVPLIQPPIMKLLTTKEERLVRMPYSQVPVSKPVRVLFPILVTVIVTLIAPVASPLIATIMFGNLMRESGVVGRLVKSSEEEIANVTTIFLGLTVGASMVADKFIRWETFGIMALGLFAFVLDMAGGVLFGKLLYWLSGKKFNPLIGVAGISAFPMSARVVQKVGQEYDYDNFLLMHAMGANVAGQLGSVMIGGIVMAMVLKLM